MRLLVMGAGAMGSVVGGFLHQAGHDVTLVGRAPHMEAVAANGLAIHGIWGEHLAHGLHTRTSPEGFEPDSFDVVLIATKAYDTASAVQAIRPLVGERTLVCSYQNGLGNVQTIAEAYGWARTIGASAIFGARVTRPGHVEVTVIAHPASIGVYRAATAGRARAFAEAMDAAGVPTRFVDDVDCVIWRKVAYNCALNALSALLDVPYGGLAETGHTQAIIGDVVRELYAVGRAMGVSLEPPDAESYLGLLFDKLIPPTAAHYSSMHEDLRRKRRSEIDAMNGAIWRYGEAHGVPCPANAQLTRLIHARLHASGVE